MKRTSRETIGKMIRMRRLEKEITPQQLANLLEVDSSTYGAWKTAR
jgi:hypothetical protein